MCIYCESRIISVVKMNHRQTLPNTEVACLHKNVDCPLNFLILFNEYVLIV